jgi:hypothetical protein
MRTLAFALALPIAVAADVVVLKEGGRVSGRVADKGGHFEVTTDTGLRTFLKDEVERVLTSPDELVAEAGPLFESAKADFQKIVAPGAPANQNDLVREAVGKLAKAREAIANARELFPEDKYASLDKRLMELMQLTRLLRDRMGSEIAKGPAAVHAPTGGAAPPPPPAAAVEPPLVQAFAVLVDAARRADPAARKGAREAFLAHRAGAVGIYDLATAAALFLAKGDPAGPALAALQEYFARLKEPLKLAPAAHLEHAKWLADRAAALKKADASASVDALSLLALGHLGHAAPGPDAAKAAGALGFSVVNGVAGTAEGHAVLDLLAFERTGDHELAHQAFVGEHRGRCDTAPVRFVWSWSLLEMAVQKKRGFDRAVNAFTGFKGDPAANEHVTALVKSIKAATPCSTCAGDGWLRCTNCHGQKTIYVICKNCNGTRLKPNGFFCNPCKFTGIAAKLVCNKCKDGYFDCPRCKLPDCKACAGGGRSVCKTCNGFKIIKNSCGACAGSGLNRTFAGAADPGGAGGLNALLCGTCKGAGTDVVRKCTGCTNGFIDCTQCEPLRKPPSVEDVGALAPCGLCEGRGSPFRGAAYACKACLGLGRRVAPKADPKKLLLE